MAHLKTQVAVLGAALWIASMIAAVPASAHHSVQAEFDIHKTFTITGKLSKIEEINPHSYMTIVVMDANGTPQKWGFEFGGPGSLRKAGLGRDALKPGDQVTIMALAAKDGSQTGLLQVLMFDGKTYKLAADAPDLPKEDSGK